MLCIVTLPGYSLFRYPLPNPAANPTDSGAFWAEYWYSAPGPSTFVPHRASLL